MTLRRRSLVALAALPLGARAVPADTAVQAAFQARGLTTFYFETDDLR